MLPPLPIGTRRRGCFRKGGLPLIFIPPPPSFFVFFQRSEGIIRDPTVLDPEYLPESLPFREAHIQEIARTISYALSGKISENLFIVGPPGVGKTAVVRYVLKQLASYSPQTFQAYINCWVYRTRYAILSRLANMLSIPVPRRG
ncbi:TPA: hypothetical protein EYP13_05435, partial [Candidatus Micrarchaeota archaeon]|nr:hypothetical protein [Candidatus Micrarchaeota archaeon]